MSEIPYKVIIEKKRIKNMYMRVLDDGTLLIRAPKNYSDQRIKEFLQSKIDWANKARDKYLDRLESSCMYRGGNIFYIFGKAYKFTHIIGNSRLTISNDEIIISYKSDKYIDYLYAKLNEQLNKKCLMYLDKYSLVLKDYGYNLIPQIKYRKMTSKWGVCYPRKNQITINSYLIHYPEECLEYVLFHELTHFIIPNHSKRFYNVVANYIPNYKEIKKKLI